MLHGVYCSSCGQHVRDIHVPVKELASEFIEVLPAFDKRLLSSMKLLLMKPGKLTEEYLAGRRKTFISPFKLYFVVSFLYFFTGSLVVTESKQDLRDAMIQSDTVRTESPIDSTVLAIKNPDSRVTFSVNNIQLLERLFGSKFIEGFKTGQNNPRQFFERIREHMPKILFLLLPVFALLLQIVYVRSRILYIQHLIFSFHFHSFIFFILLLNVLYDAAVPKGFQLYGNIILLAIPLYLYVALQNVYRQPAWKTVLKFFILSFSHFVIFIFSISIFVVATILIFYT